MRRRTLRHNSILSLILVAALALATPAFAEPVTSGDTTGTAPVAGPSAPTTTSPGSPAEDDAAAPPDASDDETDSAVPVEVDEETRKFREELARQQARIEEFKAQLDELDRELAIAVEEYNAAVEELNTTRKTLEQTRADLERAQAAYDEQVALLSERVRQMYLEGDVTALELLLDAESLSDFFHRLAFLSTVSHHDGQLVDALATERESIQQNLLDIQNAEIQAQALEFELKARQIEITLRIQERQQMLAQAQSDLLAMLDEEYERRRLEQQQLFEAIMSGASDVGIEVTPGTPVETALAYHGIPYLWGGETPAGFDCSGLVKYVFAQHGVDLPHYSGSQFLLGTRVAPQDLKPGDVVFFGSPIHHVGIYLGAGYFIHAPRTGDFVKVSPLVERTDYAGARRYDWRLREGPPAGVTVVPQGATGEDGAGDVAGTANMATGEAADTGE
ncbi:MAG: hypothetical protein Kow0056_08430 [Coriobacteriia bacterium]